VSNVLPGHALRNEGRVFWDEHLERADDSPQRRTTGSAICECGATSPVLESDRARQRWHRAHKDEMRRVKT
jgi:hypothetical protein